MNVRLRQQRSRKAPQKNSGAWNERLGSALVEMAVVMPVFGLLLAGLAEFGHTYLVINTMRTATKQAARYGVGENVNTQNVRNKLEDILGEAIDTHSVTLMVKDGSAFDSSEVDPESIVVSDLPDIEVSNAEPRQLFIVRVEVPYDSVALLPPFWVQGVTLSAQAVVRHE